jgi:hypothetical protein
MSILTPKDLKLSECELFCDGKKDVLTKIDLMIPINPLFIFSGTVKFLPEKFNKITIELVRQDLVIFEDLQTVLKGTESFLKDGCISIKLDPEQKELTKKLKKGDSLKMVIKFNDVWKMNSKKYASFKLVDFIKEEKVIINYFE